MQPAAGCLTSQSALPSTSPCYNRLSDAALDAPSPPQGTCPESSGPTVLSCRYLCHMSTVSPELALQGTSGDTMLWLTSADRWVRTVERCLQ